MGIRRIAVISLLLNVLLVGCAAFQYHWYGLEAVSYDGKLLGPKPENDIPLATCAPDAQNHGKCVVMLVDEFDRLKQDYERMQIELKNCQQAN